MNWRPFIALVAFSGKFGADLAITAAKGKPPAALNLAAAGRDQWASRSNQQQTRRPRYGLDRETRKEADRPPDSLLPARVALYARARPEMAREAQAHLAVPRPSQLKLSHSRTRL
jgi:hypothetical protein